MVFWVFALSTSGPVKTTSNGPLAVPLFEIVAIMLPLPLDGITASLWSTNDSFGCEVQAVEQHFAESVALSRFPLHVSAVEQACPPCSEQVKVGCRQSLGQVEKVSPELQTAFPQLFGIWHTPQSVEQVLQFSFPLQTWSPQTCPPVPPDELEELLPEEVL